MYVIVVYDVNVSRVNNVRKFLRQYLHWTQNSVFEGSLTRSQLKELISTLKKMSKQNEDSIRIYVLRDKFFIDEIINIGIEKGGEPDVIL